MMLLALTDTPLTSRAGVLDEVSIPVTVPLTVEYL